MIHPVCLCVCWSDCHNLTRNGDQSGLNAGWEPVAKSWQRLSVDWRMHLRLWGRGVPAVDGYQCIISVHEKTMTNEIYQGIHQVRSKNHQKVEGSVTGEDVYGGGHPRIFKIQPSAPQRQNENAGVRYQRGNPERGFKQFLSFYLSDCNVRIGTHEILCYCPPICNLGQLEDEQ